MEHAEVGKGLRRVNGAVGGVDLEPIKMTRLLAVVGLDPPGKTG